MLLFQRISDSQFTWIHDFEENWTESVGPVLFSAEYLICRHGTDGGFMRSHYTPPLGLCSRRIGPADAMVIAVAVV